MELEAIKLAGEQDGKLSTRATFADGQPSEVRVVGDA